MGAVTRSLSVRWMVSGVILATTLLVLFVGFWLTVPRTLNLLEDWMIRRFIREAQVVGDYSTSDIVFGAREESAKNLARLGSSPNVVAAALYDASGALFSRFEQPGERLEPPLPVLVKKDMEARIERHPGAVDVYQPLVDAGERLGTILIRASTAEQQHLMNRYWMAMVSVGLGLFLLAIVVALIMQRVVSRPILRLSRATEKVAQSGNWRVCIEEKGPREVRALTHSFNELLRVVALREAQRDASESARLAEAERHEMTLRCIADGVVATDVEGRIIVMNRVAEEMSGWTIQEALGHPLSEVFPLVSPSSKEPLTDMVALVMEHGRLPDDVPRAMLGSRDGSERLLAATAAAIRDRESRVVGTVFAFRDVTEQARLELEAIRAQKLESLGVLAGGIAHDFNNILTGVLGNISLCRTLLTTTDALQEPLTEAEKAVVRARNLTMQLLTFARGGMPVKKIVDIRDLVVESATFVLRGSRSRCEFDLPEDLWPVEVDPSQISQVIHNLVLNADQAMPDGGTITIRARNITAKSGRERAVRISVQDLGVGIPETLIDRVFDPYFTTKPKGIGLGLATSFSIMRHHGGTLTVESRVGVGSTFHITLPAAETPVSETYHDAVPEILGGGRVLVMDDEVLVRTVAIQILKHLGYEAEAASDGAEAVARYRESIASGRRFDVVVLDLTIPGGIGGVETLRLLREIDPDVLAIVSSGYSSDPIMSEYARHGFRGVVVKPYTVDEFGRVIRGVLAQRGSRVGPNERA